MIGSVGGPPVAGPETGAGKRAAAVGQQAKAWVGAAREAGQAMPKNAQGLAASALAQGVDPASLFAARVDAGAGGAEGSGGVEDGGAVPPEDGAVLPEGGAVAPEDGGVAPDEGLPEGDALPEAVAADGTVADGEAEGAGRFVVSEDPVLALFGVEDEGAASAL